MRFAALASALLFVATAAPAAEDSLLAAAQGGDVESMLKLGFAYRAGLDGRASTDVAAFQWVSKAADAGHALIDDSWSREQAYVALTRGRRENVLHVVAEDGDDARAVLVRVLSSSDAARAAALVAVVAERARQARVEITPGIAERIEAGLRRLSARVGSWGSGSTLTASPGVDAPVADVPAARPPVADL